MYFFIYIFFNTEIHVCNRVNPDQAPQIHANSVEPNQTPGSAAPDLGIGLKI